MHSRQCVQRIEHNSFVHERLNAVNSQRSYKRTSTVYGRALVQPRKGAQSFLDLTKKIDTFLKNNVTIAELSNEKEMLTFLCIAQRHMLQAECKMQNIGKNKKIVTKMSEDCFIGTEQYTSQNSRLRAIQKSNLVLNRSVFFVVSLI